MPKSNIMALLNPVNQETATEIVARQLIDLISSGALKRGDKLPSERQLAQHLKVGRTTVREALKLLTLSGVLEAKRGNGTYVRENYWNFIAQHIRWPTLLHSGEINQLMEIRIPLERQSVRLAAGRATEEDLNKIEAISKELANLGERNIELETDIDLRFHHSVAVAAKNELLVEIVSVLREPLRKYIEQSNRMTADISSTIHEHKAICRALRRRDPSAAVQAMNEHLDISRFLALLGASSNSQGSDQVSVRDNEQKGNVSLSYDGGAA